MNVNLNTRIKAKLNKRGIVILHNHLKQFYSQSKFESVPYQADDDDWISFELWDFMNIFGPHMALGMDPPTLENEIQLETNDDGTFQKLINMIKEFDELHPLKDTVKHNKAQFAIAFFGTGGVNLYGARGIDIDGMRLHPGMGLDDIDKFLQHYRENGLDQETIDRIKKEMESL